MLRHCIDTNMLEIAMVLESVRNAGRRWYKETRSLALVVQSINKKNTHSYVRYEDNVNVLRCRISPMETHRWLFENIRIKCDEIPIIKLLKQRSPYGVCHCKACNLSSFLFWLLAILLAMETGAAAMALRNCTVFWHAHTVNCPFKIPEISLSLSLYPVLYYISFSIVLREFCNCRHFSFGC